MMSSSTSDGVTDGLRQLDLKNDRCQLGHRDASWTPRAERVASTILGVLFVYVGTPNLIAT